MKALDRELLTIQSEHLFTTYSMTYGQIARYLKKTTGFDVNRSTVFRWLNKTACCILTLLIANKYLFL